MTARTGRARAALALVVTLGAALACRSAAPVRTEAITRTVIASAGDIVGVVELGDALYLFARDQVTIERAGAIAASARAPRSGWAEAIAMPALDEPGRWVVARTQAGELWRITASGEVEPIHDRLGVPPQVRSIAASGATAVLALDDGVAIVRDRAHLARFAGPTGTVIAHRDRIAIRHDDQLEIWNLMDQTRTRYRVPGAIAAAFAGDARGTLVVATRDALFIETATTLRQIAVPGIHALAAAGSRLWVASARGVELPIFERVCARCHRPGGDAGVDLSTAAAWRRERGELVHRVVETHTMPPAGITLDEPDRRVLAGWLAH